MLSLDERKKDEAFEAVIENAEEDNGLFTPNKEIFQQVRFDVDLERKINAGLTQISHPGMFMEVILSQGNTENMTKRKGILGE